MENITLKELYDQVMSHDGDDICTVFYSDDDSDPTIFDKEDMRKRLFQENTSQKVMEEKRFENSTQATAEIGQGISSNIAHFKEAIAPPPYNPADMAFLFGCSPIHAQACTAKAKDSVCRDFKIVPKYPIKKDDVKENTYGKYVDPQVFRSDYEKIEKFIDNVNSDKTFQELAYLAALDKEAIGWGALEVIRDNSGKIARLERIPAVRLRVLEGSNGYVEINHIRTTEMSTAETSYRYYQPFGEKIKAKIEDPFDFTGRGSTVLDNYNPDRDGELNVIENENLEWNLYSKITGEPTKDFSEAANEVLFFANNHINTIYYGYSDVYPAVPNVLINVEINKYRKDFFENNCVPRYAIIIKGVKVSEDFKKEISDYLDKKVKGKNHQTMVLGLSMRSNNVDIEFKRLDTQQKEADFLKTLESNNQEIITSHRIPPALLAVMDSANLGSGKGTAQADLYKDRFIVTSQAFYASRFNKLFRLGLGVTTALIKFDPLDIKDSLQTAQVLQILLLQGALTINEARRQLGMEPIEGADTAFVRVKESSLIKVEDIPNIAMKLNDDQFNQELKEKLQEEGETVIDIEELTGQA